MCNSDILPSLLQDQLPFIGKDGKIGIIYRIKAVNKSAVIQCRIRHLPRTRFPPFELHVLRRKGQDSVWPAVRVRRNWKPELISDFLQEGPLSHQTEVVGVEEVGHPFQTSWARVPYVHSFLTSLGNPPETGTYHLLLQWIRFYTRVIAAKKKFRIFQNDTASPDQPPGLNPIHLSRPRSRIPLKETSR